MCEKLTSHLFRVREREMLVHTISSHSETREKLGLSDKDGNVIEVEWFENKESPDFRWEGNRADAEEQTLVREWYAKRFPDRWDLIRCCIIKSRGSLDLSGCDLSKVKELVLPESIGGSLYLSGCDLSKVKEWPKSIGGSIYLSDCDLSKAKIPGNLKSKVAY